MTVWERGAVAFRPQGRRWERDWVGSPGPATALPSPRPVPAAPATRRPSQQGTRPIVLPAAPYHTSGRAPGRFSRFFFKFSLFAHSLYF